jgi:hypothetical protein
MEMNKLPNIKYTENYCMQWDQLYTATMPSTHCQTDMQLVQNTLSKYVYSKFAYIIHLSLHQSIRSAPFHPPRQVRFEILDLLLTATKQNHRTS